MFSSWVSNSFLLQKLRGLKSGGCPFRFGKLEFFQQNIFYCSSSVWVWVKIVQNGRVYMGSLLNTTSSFVVSGPNIFTHLTIFGPYWYCKKGSKLGTTNSTHLRSFLVLNMGYSRIAQNCYCNLGKLMVNHPILGPPPKFSDKPIFWWNQSDAIFFTGLRSKFNFDTTNNPIKSLYIYNIRI